ncbi:MAG: DUF2177 family protein [Pseudomonadota bacterium]
MQLARAFVAAAVTFLILDIIWLTFIAFEIFQREVGGLLRAEPNLIAAGAFYVIYMFGLTVLAIAPAVRAGSLAMALWLGAVLGLTAYGTFDLTSLAVIEGWTVTATVVDMIWGVTGTSAAAVVGYLAAGRAANTGLRSAGANKL